MVFKKILNKKILGIKKRIFIFGIFPLFVNISFLGSEEILRYKLIFVGDQKVGKSCIFNRFINNTFTDKYLEK